MFPVCLDLWPQILQQMKSAGKEHLLTLVQYPEAGHLIEPPYTPHFRFSRFNKNCECEAAFGFVPFTHVSEPWFALQRLLCGGGRPNPIQTLRRTPGRRSWPFYSSTCTPTRLPVPRCDRRSQKGWWWWNLPPLAYFTSLQDHRCRLQWPVVRYPDRIHG